MAKGAPYVAEAYAQDTLDVPADQPEDLPPDGGFGWVVVAASFCILFMSLGVNYTFGVFLEHYTEKWDGRVSYNTLTWIGTLSSSLLSLAAGAGGILAEKVGFPLATFIGGSVFSAGLLLASFSTQVWHLFVTQGFMVGFGAAIMFITASSAPSQWFSKRRGLATGICLTGSGLGGLIIAPITDLMLSSLGAEVTLRIAAAVFFIVTCICAPFLKSRVPIRPEKRMIDLRIFRNAKFRALLIAEFTSCFGFLVPHLIMPMYAIYHGIDKSSSALLVGLISGGSAMGSVVLGFAADFAGPLNILSCSMLGRALICILFWVFSVTFAPLAVFNFLYGVSSGAFLSLTPVVVSRLFGLEDMASINGLIYLGAGIPELIGTPLATYILDSTSRSQGEKNFIPTIIYCGSAALISFFVMIYLKLLVQRKLFSIV
ncbi:hypothetical protein DSO57_1036466 [Entomophthora muscae]|uniref:Uncharacterized protein n=1 Tax=Entomophthora muscae TaxID=34485 RepID=A0ACC2SNA4_9FUNG|nr:hypothetical protein DSO57_1036466 [Entomophthora muscae]